MMAGKPVRAGGHFAGETIACAWQSHDDDSIGRSATRRTHAPTTRSSIRRSFSDVDHRPRCRDDDVQHRERGSPRSAAVRSRRSTLARLGSRRREHSGHMAVAAGVHGSPRACPRLLRTCGNDRPSIYAHEPINAGGAAGGRSLAKSTSSCSAHSRRPDGSSETVMMRTAAASSPCSPRRSQSDSSGVRLQRSVRS